MAKKRRKVEDFEVDIETKKVKVKAKKEGDKLDVVVDTPKVDVEIRKDKDKKEFVYDSEKLDVNVTKTEEGTTIDVDAKNGFLKWVGGIIGRFMKRRFNKKKKNG